MQKYYFDYASTTPTDPQVLTAMEPFFFERFGNPSSPHAFGRGAKKIVEESRETLAQFLKAQPEEVIFTSGGSESNNHAIVGVARALKNRGNHIIVSAIEHHSALRPAEFLKEEGFRVTDLPVDPDGRVDSESVRKAIGEKTILIVVMHASNEIGTIQDVAAIGKVAREKGVCFHVDAVQTVGHIPVDVNAIGCTTLSLSAHKLYGPKGVGALYIRKGTPLQSYLLGGDQESGRRASTLNVPAIVGLAKAAQICRDRMPEEIKTQTELRDRLIAQIPHRVEGAHLNGHPNQRLPNNVHFSFNGIESESLLMVLDMAGIAASMGSACTSGALVASHVLVAIGLSDELAFGSLRISIGRWTTSEHIEYLLKELPVAINRLRK